MDVGKIKIADQSDFDRLKELCEIHDDWTQVYRSDMTLVWTRANDVSDFNMVKVRPLYSFDLFSHYRQHFRACASGKASSILKPRHWF